ncbi:hypothetical protein ScPMuIL_001390 [Solemya velum]
MSDNYRMCLYGKENVKLEQGCPTPSPSYGEIQVRIHTVGICGTDIHMWQSGELGGAGIKFPIVMGHEATGSISCVGGGVTKLRVGDRVALEAIIACRQCHGCLSGKYNICQDRNILGTERNGFQQKFVVVPERNCHILPVSIPLDTGVLLEPLSVTVHACERGQVAIGDVVVISGSGSVGLLQMQTVKAAGAQVVYITDILPERLALAASLGADHTLDVSNMDSKEVARRVEKTLGKKADVTFECVGNDQSIATSIYATRSGGRVVIVGVPSGISRVPVDDAVLKEIDIITTLGYKDSFPKAISLLEQGKVKVAGLITDRYGLGDIDKAYRHVRSGAGIKSVMSLE